MMRGAILNLPGASNRQNVVLLAALAKAMDRPGVHLCVPYESDIDRFEKPLQKAAKSLDLSLGIVRAETPLDDRHQSYRAALTLASARELASDMLRDTQTSGTGASPLSMKVNRLRPKTGRHQFLLPGLTTLILAEADIILLDLARAPVVLAGPAEAIDTPDAIREAIGLADILQDGNDYQIADDTVVLTKNGTDQIAYAAHLYPNLAPLSAMGQRCLRDAIATQKSFAEGVHFAVENGSVQRREAPDQALIAFDEARPFIEIAHDLDPQPRQVPVARASLQRLFSRYQSVAGVGVAFEQARREMAALYGASHLKTIHRRAVPKPRHVRVETDAKIVAIVKRKAAKGPVHVFLPEDPDARASVQSAIEDADIPNLHLHAADAPPEQIETAPGTVIFLTAAGPRRADLRWFEALSSQPPRRALRIIDTRRAPYTDWPRPLRRGVEALPTPWLRNVACDMIQRSILHLQNRATTRIRQDLFDYDQRLDTMLSFAGEAE